MSFCVCLCKRLYAHQQLLVGFHIMLFNSKLAFSAGLSEPRDALQPNVGLHVRLCFPCACSSMSAPELWSCPVFRTSCVSHSLLMCVSVCVCACAKKRDRQRRCKQTARTSEVPSEVWTRTKQQAAEDRFLLAVFLDVICSFVYFN